MVATLFVGAGACGPKRNAPGGLIVPAPVPADVDVGSIQLAVVVGPNVALEQVHYSLGGNGIAPRTGDIAVTAIGATPSVLVGGVPAGVGYLVELTSAATDGVTTCSGHALVDVIANATSGVNVVLLCRAPSKNGSVSVSVIINACPQVGFTTAAPVRASVARWT